MLSFLPLTLLYQYVQLSLCSLICLLCLVQFVQLSTTMEGQILKIRLSRLVENAFWSLSCIPFACHLCHLFCYQVICFRANIISNVAPILEAQKILSQSFLVRLGENFLKIYLLLNLLLVVLLLVVLLLVVVLLVVVLLVVNLKASKFSRSFLLT